MMLDEAENSPLRFLCHLQQGNKESSQFGKEEGSRVSFFHDAYKKFCSAARSTACAVGPWAHGMPNTSVTIPTTDLSSHRFFLVVPAHQWRRPGPSTATGAARAEERFHGEDVHRGSGEGPCASRARGRHRHGLPLKRGGMRQPDGTVPGPGPKVFVTAGDHDLTTKGHAPRPCPRRGRSRRHQGRLDLRRAEVPREGRRLPGGACNDVSTAASSTRWASRARPPAALSFGEERRVRGRPLGQGATA